MYTAIALLVACLGVCMFASAQNNLEAIYLDTLLPYGFAFMPVVYDGNDSIYILGGKYSAWHIPRDILKYSIRNNQVEVIGAMVDLDNNSGSGVWVPGNGSTGMNGSLLYFGGTDITGLNPRSEIFQLDLDASSNEMVTVGNLPRTCSMSTSVWDGADHVYVIGGYWRSCPCAMDTITKFSLVDGTAENLLNKFPGLGGRYSTSAALDPSSSGAIYIFGGRVRESVYSDEILRLEYSTGNITLLPARLPDTTDSSCAVTTNEYIYIFGGNRNVQRPGVVRFTPATGQVESLEITNFPVKISGMGCVYVQKLNRIYIFGGYEFEFNNYNRGERIFIINLD